MSNPTHLRDIRSTVNTTTHPSIMRRLLILVIASLLTACSSPQKDTSAEQPDITNETPARSEKESARLTDNVQELTVNGIRVIVKRRPHAPLVTANVYFDGGAPYWNPETSGAEQLALSVATTAGPQGISKNKFQSLLDKVGAVISAGSTPDYAYAHLNTLKTSLNSIWPLFTRTITTPSFPDDEVKIARNKQLSAIRTRMDSPDSAVAEVAKSLMFKGHPYELHAEGELDSMQSLTTEDLRHALNQLRIRERMLVVLVGDITNEQAIKMVDDGFGDVPSNPGWEKELAVVENPTLVSEAPRLDIHERAKLPTNYIIGYFTAPGHTDADYPAMVIASKLLRERLFEEVRTKRNLTYAVSAGLGSRRDNIGYLYVTATDPKTTLSVMFDTIDSFIENPPSEEVLHNQVMVYLTEYYMSLQSPNAQASALAEWELRGDGWENIDSLHQELRSLQPSDIAQTLKEHVQNLTFGVVGDPEEIPRELFLSR